MHRINPIPAIEVLQIASTPLLVETSEHPSKIHDGIIASAHGASQWGKSKHQEITIAYLQQSHLDENPPTAADSGGERVREERTREKKTTLADSNVELVSEDIVTGTSGRVKS